MSAALDMAEAMMKLILGSRNHVENYCKFLHEQDSYKVVNLDQWMSFLEFSRTIAADLSDYDENSACTSSRLADGLHNL